MLLNWGKLPSSFIQNYTVIFGISTVSFWLCPSPILLLLTIHMVSWALEHAHILMTSVFHLLWILGVGTSISRLKTVNNNVSIFGRDYKLRKFPLNISLLKFLLAWSPKCPRPIQSHQSNTRKLMTNGKSEWN